MNRLACANLPALPLQLLLRRHPEWRAYPAAVIAEDKAQGMILWANRSARQAGAHPGLRYAGAASLAPQLRAGTVPPAEINKEVSRLTKEFMRFTPHVEPSAEEAGVFLLDGIGLALLYPSLKEWARAIHAAVKAREFRAAVVVGFTRFGTYAVAKSEEGTIVFENPSEERAAAREVPLERLELEPDFYNALLKLGVRSVGALLSLPVGGLRERFGPSAHRLYRMASGDLWDPLKPCAPEEAARQRVLLDDPETDSTRLLFLIKRPIQLLLAALAARGEALGGLWLRLLIEKSGWLNERIRPAEPTLDSIQLVDLVRLRLEALKLSAGVEEIELEAEGCPASGEQMRFFVERPERDLAAANRALARLRAEFGEEAVVRAQLTDGHLPSARFTWEPLDRVEFPSFERLCQKSVHGSTRGSPRTDGGTPKFNHLAVRPEHVEGRTADCGTVSQRREARTLTRRILAKPVALSSQPRTHYDGWLLLGPGYGTVERLSGPYILSGGWWNREIHREYYFAETRSGDILWVYYDRVRRRWFLQGRVE